VNLDTKARFQFTLTIQAQVLPKEVKRRLLGLLGLLDFNREIGAQNPG